MSEIEPLTSFVKEQISFHEKMAKKYDDNPYRHNIHLKTRERFQELEAYLQEIADRGTAKFDANNRSAKAQKRIQLTLEDIQDIPDDLLKELNVSDTDKQELLIEHIIATSGGVSSIDKILVELYRRTREVNKRNTLISRLYRMVQRGVIYRVPGKNGVYSTYELSPQEAKNMFGQTDDGEEASPAAPSTPPAPAPAPAAPPTPHPGDKLKQRLLSSAGSSIRRA